MKINNYKIVFRNNLVDIYKQGINKGDYYVWRIPYNPIKYAKQLIIKWHMNWYNKRMAEINK